jgi:predicted metal-dependent enzyme (double-stranded beta helix superfamily)
MQFLPLPAAFDGARAIDVTFSNRAYGFGATLPSCPLLLPAAGAVFASSTEQPRGRRYFRAFFVSEALVTHLAPESLKRFIWDIQSMVELAESEREILMIGRDLMMRLIAVDDWLPPAFSTADPACGQQFQLYSDAMERFTIVSTVLAPGHASAVGVEPFWQICGVLRGAFSRRSFNVDTESRILPGCSEQKLESGAILTSSARGAAQLVNLHSDRVSIAIQVFGGDIGKTPRLTLTPEGAAQFGPTSYANVPDAPPYDIWTIQTRVED